MQQRLKTLLIRAVAAAGHLFCLNTSGTEPLGVYDLSSIVDTTGSVYDLPNNAKCSPRSEEREREQVNGGPKSKKSFNSLPKILLDFKLL